MTSELGIQDPYRRLVEAVHDYAIFLLDAQGRVASWNPGAQRIKGYRADEIIGQHFSRFYPEEAIDRGWPQEELALAAARGRLEDEGWRVRKDGSRFWASVVITALRDERGELRGFGKIMRDLTDRKRIEALEKAERQTNEFLAMLAHELRNPLAPISNAVNLLVRKPTSDPAELWVREVLQRQTGQMARLVEDLLDVSRITRAAVVLDRKPVDLRSIVRNAADASRQWFDERSHALELSLPEERLMVEADEVRLNQVVQNLLHNAARYTPCGGRILLGARREHDEAVIRVRDSGVGMAPELLTSAFDLFKQGSQGLERTQGGLGVGLTLVQRLIMLHGGSVAAHSEGPGRGSEFVVRLPLREEPAIVRDAPPPAPRASQAGPRRRILLVDDNQDAAQALRLLLEADGHEVRVAGDGPSGLAMAHVYCPDTVLLDIGLPKMDGYELARRIRADAALEGAVLIAVTGYGQMHDRARASASGFHHHLVKPVDFAELRELLRANV